MGMTPPGSHGPVIWWGGWGGRRRKPESGPANSGLTGDPTLEPPQQPEGPKDLRGRWETFKQAVTGTTAALPQVLRLVWEASRPTTIGLFATTALAGLVPTASVGLTLMLTNAVKEGIDVHQNHLADRLVLSNLGVPWLPHLTFSVLGMIVFLAILQFVIFAVSALLNTLRNISQQLLQNSVSMRIQLMVMEKAASLDLPFYEDAASYDLLRRAQNDSINRPVLMIATAFGLLQTALTFVTMIAVLVGVSPLLALLALASPIVASLTYLYVALQAIAGRLTLGHLIAYTQAATAVQNSIQSILGGFSGMYEHNLYLNNLIELMSKEPTMPVTADAKPVPDPLKGE